MCIDNVNKSFFWVVPIIAKLHLSKEEVPDCISSKFLNQLIWFKCIP